MEVFFPMAMIFFIWPSSKPLKRYAKEESMGITSMSYGENGTRNKSCSR
jgi:hypothetical protein